MSSPIIKTGFKETLIPNKNKTAKLTPKITLDKSKEICSSILKTGNEIYNDEKYRIPSQFPLLTSNTKSDKKKGGKKYRTYKKTLKKRIKKH